MKRILSMIYIGEEGTYSDVLFYAPEGIMFDAQKQIFALPILLKTPDTKFIHNFFPQDEVQSVNAEKSAGLVVSVSKNNKLTLASTFPTNDPHEYSHRDNRMITLGNRLYFATSDSIRVYSYPRYHLVDSLALN